MLPQNGGLRDNFDSEPLGDFAVKIVTDPIDVASIPPLPPDVDETTSLLPRKSRRETKKMHLTIESHHQRTSDEVMPSDFKMKSIKMLSWNTFSIPFANPRFLSNPLKCCQTLENMLNETGILINEENGDNELVLFCFQELWAFKVGIFPKFVFGFLKYMECIPILGYLLVMLSFLITQIQAFVLSLFVNITRCYNPKDIVAQYFDFLHCVQFTFIPWTQLMDNGLLILCNHSPSKSGYHRFENMKHEDALVSKGFIWCYFEALNLMVINTHLQAAGGEATQIAQLDEIRDFIDDRKEEFGCSDCKVLIAGDFNIDMMNITIDIGNCLNLTKMNDFRPTFPEDNENIDHVFTDLPISEKTTHLFQSAISDHRALFMEMSVA